MMLSYLVRGHGGRLLCQNLPEAQARIVSRVAINIQISHQNIQIWRPAMSLRSYPNLNLGEDNNEMETKTFLEPRFGGYEV
jgi:hypothetical protein